MTQFTRKSFSVASPHTEEYGDNFDRIFRRPALDDLPDCDVGAAWRHTVMERWSRVAQLFTRVVSEELTPEQASDYFVQGGGERAWFESMWMLIKEI